MIKFHKELSMEQKKYEQPVYIYLKIFLYKYLGLVHTGTTYFFPYDLFIVTDRIAKLFI